MSIIYSLVARIDKNKTVNEHADNGREIILVEWS